ncbi:sel1 repeat family protein [Pelomyxa schiedti]|nr:sel1 repeat family protein [Pelomyxa schiedti]
MATECLSSWADGDTHGAYLLSLQLVLGGARCGEHRHLRGKWSQLGAAEQQREVYRRQVVPASRAGESRPESDAAALASLVWTFLVTDEAGLLEPLWPLDFAVSDQFGVSGNKQAYGPQLLTDNAKSLEHIKIAADRGHPLAQVWLYIMHGLGYIEYLHKSASQGCCAALTLLGLGHMTVDETTGLSDVPLNCEEGLRLLQMGAEKGEPLCQFAMFENSLRKEDKMKWLKLACDRGLPEAQYAMSVILGSPVSSRDWGLDTNNQEEALRLLKLSAVQGNTKAQTLMGTLFMEGKRGCLVVKQDSKKAILYLSMASKAGNHQAQFKLGHCYLTGTAVKKDEAKALRLLQQAACGEVVEAHLCLGMMYEDGTKVTPKDTITAGQHYRQAIQLAHQENAPCPQAAWLLCKLIWHGLAPGTSREAMQLLRESTDSEIPETWIGLGEVYEYGFKGVTKDVREAVRWYRMASSFSSSVPLQAEASYRLTTYTEGIVAVAAQPLQHGVKRKHPNKK